MIADCNEVSRIIAKLRTSIEVVEAQAKRSCMAL
jgi:hypothetical protein